MKASSSGGLGRMASYRWLKNYVVRTKGRRNLRAHVKRAAHRADRQAARVELHGYVDERYEGAWADDCDGSYGRLN